MKTEFTKSIMKLVPLLILLISLLPSCAANGTPPVTSPTPSSILQPGTDLSFEHYPVFGEYKDLESVPTGIHVMVSNQSELPSVFDNITADSMANLMAFDFSRYFIVFVFMGFQPVQGPSITIERIWQIQDIIYVRANFDPDGPTYQPLWTAPAQIVKVSKDNMTQYGQITFKLMDQYGVERATTVQIVTR
jgi:hypothetical protein